MLLNILKNSVISPLISFIIPTLNSAKVLSACLKSIANQNYLNYEILIVDGGSTDSTLEIAKRFKCQIIHNPLKSAEAAKALGLKKVHSKFVALIDSDNILPSKNWLQKMLLPFKDSEIIGSEPIAFTYRQNSGFIERYSALIGANDPFAYISGISDRINSIDHQWTHLNLSQENFSSYIKIKLIPKHLLPTIGANGTIFRTSFLKKYFSGNYLFDIDIITQALVETQKPLYFAKVKIGIIHSFCESSIPKFIRKQDRRLRDYFTHLHQRSFDYSNNFSDNIFKNVFLLVKNNLYFTLYSLLLFPSLIDSLRGFFNKPDMAWFFHPFACFITFWIYFYISILSLLGVNLTLNRNKWQQ